MSGHDTIQNFNDIFMFGVHVYLLFAFQCEAQPSTARRNSKFKIQNACMVNFSIILNGLFISAKLY